MKFVSNHSWTQELVNMTKRPFHTEKVFMTTTQYPKDLINMIILLTKTYVLYQRKGIILGPKIFQQIQVNHGESEEVHWCVQNKFVANTNATRSN
mmetsp:Transcript_37214/g.75851  ORF Transcript_37214/g.75851 Transcript_37214/m.75851 type:complete len:95 (+) Transcript_37214:1179-1463(+)